MATITTNTFLDDGVARIAGETFNINGGVLTIRTDTRVHANAPASMTGSIGTTTLSATLGGDLIIDGRNVRWMPYNSGSGNVPAIGTNVTQAGVTSSYLLGVYADLTSAPTAPGAAMPASGFIKFREVSGVFVAGALTGIGASATGPDVVGWIEVVVREAAAFTVSRLNEFVVRGDWFELGTTTGTPAQIVQVPTNGGGANTHVPAIWIETGVGTGVYEAYPSVTTTFFNATNLGTDQRAKLVHTIGSGQVRIGNNGSVNCGYTPPAGCKIRVPNVFGRSSVVANDALNTAPNATLGARPDFSTANAGTIDIENFLSDWYHLYSAAYNIRHVNLATYDNISLTNIASPFEMDNVVVSAYNTTSSIPLQIATCTLGGTIDNSNFVRGTSIANGHISTYNASNNIEVTNSHFTKIDFTRVVSGYAMYGTFCTNLNFNNCYQYNAGSAMVTCVDSAYYNIDHTDRLVGNTTTAIPLYGVAFSANCFNVGVYGLTCGLNGLISGVNPYAGLFNSANCTNVTFRNGGSLAAPISVPSNALAPAYIYQDSGVNTNLRVQNCFVQETRTSPVITVNTSMNQIFENLFGTVGAVQILSNESSIRGSRCASNSVTGGASVYGTHSNDIFVSDTAGHVWFAFNEPTATTTPYVSYTFGPNAGFTSTGQVAMPNVNDQITIEMSYDALGHTGFALNQYMVIPTNINPQNFNYDYQIDTGSGFSSWKRLISSRVKASGGTVGTNTFVFTAVANAVLPQVGDYLSTTSATQYFTFGTTVTDVTGTTVTVSSPILSTIANGPVFFINPELIAETISASNGFKLKIRVTTADALSTNTFTYLRIDTTTSLAAQTTNLYPLEQKTVTYQFRRLEPGTEVVLFDSAWNELIRGTSVGTTFDYTYEWNSTDGDTNDCVALIWKDDQIAQIIQDIDLTDTDNGQAVILLPDLLYSAPVSTDTTFDGPTGRHIMDAGVTTISIQQLYSEWKDWLRLSTNTQYGYVYEYVGGNPVTGAISIPFFLFLNDGWKIRPQEANHTLNVVEGILVATGDPFVNTLGAFTIRINYQQPVQVLTVSTGGVTPTDVANSVWNKLTSENNEAGSFGELLSILMKYEKNRTRIDGTAKTLTVYDNDGTTPLRVFDLKDLTGTPSITEIAERVPQ